MPKRPFTRDQFLTAGLQLLRQNGYKNLETKRQRAAIFVSGTKPEGDSFVARFRSTMDRGLLATAESNDPDASPKIEGEGLTHLLLLTTSQMRTRSPLEAYLIPMDVAVNALKENHRRWLSTNPRHSNPEGSVTRWIALEPDRLTPEEFSSQFIRCKLEGHVPEGDPSLLDQAPNAKQERKDEPQPHVAQGQQQLLEQASIGELRDAFKKAVAREHGVQEDKVILKIEIIS